MVKTRHLLIVGVSLATAPLVFGHDGHEHPPKPVPPEVAHHPTAIPDRIILTFAGDPSRSQAVSWRTDASVARGMGQIARAEDGPGFVEKATEVAAETAALETNLGRSHHHSVLFEGLEPHTDYLYRVGDGVNWSEWIRFRTASEEHEPFSFIYFGDAQNELKAHWSRVVREAYSDAPKAKFLLHAGDLINRGDADQEWGEWFQAGGWVNAMMPNLPTPGNHEYSRLVSGPRALTAHWRAQFALPTHGPEGLEESVYYIDYQGVRFISLNSNERQEEQIPWLEGVLGENPNRWTVVTFHHPIFSSARGRDNAVLRQLWQPLFDKYKVDLVLQGHDHTYARSGLITYEENVASGASVRNGDTGTVYVVSVSGPKMYDLERENWMIRAAEDTQLYQIITIDGSTLTYQARTATGKLYDTFVLNKREGQPNELRNEIPEELEHLRPAAPVGVEAGSSR